MTDVHDIKTRSYNMSRIKGRNTAPELMVRKYLHAKGLRFSLHNKKLPGKPDLCFTKFKTVVFVNGCFWHGHKNCKYFRLPKTRTEWWREKINATIERDHKNMEKLKQAEWKTIVVWECELKSDNRKMTLNNLYNQIIK